MAAQLAALGPWLPFSCSRTLLTEVMSNAATLRCVIRSGQRWHRFGNATGWPSSSPCCRCQQKLSQPRGLPDQLDGFSVQVAMFLDVARATGFPLTLFDDRPGAPW